MACVLQEAGDADPKCKLILNLLSFLTLAYTLDCLICAKDIMIIVFLLQMMGYGKIVGREVIHLCFGLVLGKASGCHIPSILFYFFLCFSTVVNCSIMTGA